MAGLTGNFVARDGSGNGTTPKGARLANGGAFAPNGSSPLDVRKGILADAGGPVVSGTGAMSYSVRAFVAVSMASSSNGPTVFANDGAVTVTTDPAPGSNSRIDVIYARQRLLSGDGGSESVNTVEIDVAKGTVAAVPSAPSIPTGALSLAQVLVSAGTTATNALTFTRTHNWTAARGGVIPVTSSEKPTAAYRGQAVYNLDTSALEIYDGSTWSAAGGTPAIRIMYLAANKAIPTNTETTIDTWSASTFSVPGTGITSYSSGVITFLKSGLYRVKVDTRWTNNSASYRDIYFYLNGTKIVTGGGLPTSGGSLSATVERTIKVAANDTLYVAAKQNAGTSLNILGGADASVFEIEFKGAA